jgi:pimeloyl-ACP methyl ester carboxylesterase
VLVLPGYAASDASTWILREYLTRLGYHALPWQLGRNRGGANGALGAQLADRLDQIHQDAGTVSLVGWSLGGVFARMLGRRFPDKVRQIITLGSPIGGRPTATSVYRMYANTGHPRAEAIRTAPEHVFSAEPIPGIPSTAIFSRTDGVVSWQIAREKPTGLADNIEVVGSHVGLGVNPAVLYAVADRLAQDPESWQPFHRAGWRQFVYTAVQAGGG